MDKKITLLLMEKDPAACKKMINEIAKNEDVLALAGITNNPNRAMQYVFEAHPDAVILGTGGENDDGTEFLKILKAADIARPPFVLALTESTADGDTAKEYGADFIMCKTADGDTAREAAELLRITAPVIAERRAKDGYAEEKQGKAAPPGAVPLDGAYHRQNLRGADNELERPVFGVAVNHLVALVFDRPLTRRVLHCLTPYSRSVCPRRARL